MVVVVALCHLMVFAILSTSLLICVRKEEKPPSVHRRRLPGWRNPSPQQSPQQRPPVKPGPLADCGTLSSETNLSELQEELSSHANGKRERSDTGSNTSAIRPRAFENDDKQERIAMGLEIREKSDYPTMKDILSDWTSRKEKTSTSKTQFDTKTQGTLDVMPRRISGSSASACLAASQSQSTQRSFRKYGSTLSESRTQLSTPAVAPAAVDDGASSMVSLEPREANLPATGGTSVHLLINATLDRLAFKVKITNNVDYRLNPVFGFVEPLNATQIEVHRSPGPVRRDRLEVYYKPTTHHAANARATFANKKYAGVIKIRLNVLSSR